MTDEKSRPLPSRPNTPSEALQKSAFNKRAKASMKHYLSSLTWEEKIASIQRMNEADKLAKVAMQKFMDAKKAK